MEAAAPEAGRPHPNVARAEPERPAGPAFGPALLRGLFGALLAAGLAVPILAIRTEQSPDGLALTLRPHLVAFAAVVGFGFALSRAAGFRRPVGSGGAGPGLKLVVILLAAALLAAAYPATLHLAPPIAAILLPKVPVSFMTLDLWLNLSAAALAALLLQAVLPSGPRGAARQDRKSAVTTSADPRAQSGHGFAVVLGPLFLGLALGFPAIAAAASGGLSEARYWIDLGILILTYVMLGWGLNIVVGLAGLLDLGYVAFYAVGAYSYALLAKTFDLSFWACLPLAGILAAFWGILLGFPVLRLRGDYLAIVTLAFGEIIRLVLINWVDVTGGGAGISSIPRASFFGIPFTNDEDGFASRFGLAFSPMHRIVFLYYLILALALLTNVVTVRLRRLPVGRAWEALREDEIACRSLGINTTSTKLTAFAIGAMFGGFAGSFFAVRQGFISPESFNFLESATILAIVVLGGMGSQIGVALAAVLMVGAPELLRNLDVLKQVFGPGFDPSEYRLLLFGLAMVAMMIWRPRGLVSVREPSVVLRERKAISGSLVREGHG